MDKEELCTEIYDEYKTMCANSMCGKCKLWSPVRNCVVDFVLTYLEEHNMLKEGVINE